MSAHTTWLPPTEPSIAPDWFELGIYGGGKRYLSCHSSSPFVLEVQSIIFNIHFPQSKIEHYKFYIEHEDSVPVPLG